MVKSNDISPARLAAFSILQQVEEGAFSSVLLAAIEPRLQPLDRALCHELVLGVLRRRLLLDRIIEHYTRREVSGLDAPVRIALRLGLYQLRFLTRIPASAAVNESVSLVRVARLSSARSLVNAVLRRASREPEYDPVVGVTDPHERVSLLTSHPLWLLDRWATSFGFDHAAALAEANNEASVIVFRVVQERARVERVLLRLVEAGAKIEPSEVIDGAWRVSGAIEVVRELSTAGEIYLQDDASQLVAHSLAAGPDDRVLDLCAAPGGKTTLIADLVGDDTLVVAADRSATRLRTVIATKNLHELESVEPVQLDATDSLPFVDGAFDRVLVDAPCSGTGTLRRNPEIRWRLTPLDIEKLVKQQHQILSRALGSVKPGGRLIYSTCSVEREENEEVIERVLGGDERFRPLSVTRTWPHLQKCDGFFIAVFERRVA